MGLVYLGAEKSQSNILRRKISYFSRYFITKYNLNLVKRREDIFS